MLHPPCGIGTGRTTAEPKLRRATTRERHRNVRDTTRFPTKRARLLAIARRPHAASWVHPLLGEAPIGSCSDMTTGPSREGGGGEAGGGGGDNKFVFHRCRVTRWLRINRGRSQRRLGIPIPPPWSFRAVARGVRSLVAGAVSRRTEANVSGAMPGTSSVDPLYRRQDESTERRSRAVRVMGPGDAQGAREKGSTDWEDPSRQSHPGETDRPLSEGARPTVGRANRPIEHASVETRGNDDGALHRGSGPPCEAFRSMTRHR